MKSADNVGVTFINYVVGRGVMNGVANLTLGTYAFDPSEDEKTVEVAPFISARLRMDVPTVRALHATLGELLQQIDGVSAETQPVTAAENSVDGDGKPLN